MKRLLRIIISFVLLVLSVGGAVLFLWPSYQSFAQLRAQVKEHEERFQQGQETILLLQAALTQAQTREQDFEKAEQAIPRDAGIPALLDHVQELAALSGVVLQSVSDEERQAEEGSGSDLTTVVLKLELGGSYEGLKNFLDAARRSLRMLNVNSVQVEASGEEAGVLSLNIEVLSYSVP